MEAVSVDPVAPPLDEPSPTRVTGARAAGAPHASLSERYAAMPHGFEPRPVDAVLRAADVAIAGSLLVALGPLIAVIGAGVRLTSGSPVLYRGARVGRGGKTFTMVKYRTLKPDAETRLGPYLGEELMRRTELEVTRLGRVLRALQLDELPQLYNVLVGDMSMVGPRPIRPAFFEALGESIPQYWQRLVVRPGLTGFAQLRMTREMSWEDKLAHDLEYLADRSLSLYLRMLGQTVARLAGRARGELAGERRFG